MKKALFFIIGICTIQCIKAQVLDWASMVGNGVSSTYAQGNEVEVDKDGNSYYIGVYSIYTAGGTIDFDPGPGTFIGTAPGTTGAQSFIVKLDPNGNFVWCKFIKGTAAGSGAGRQQMVLDSAKNIYILGLFVGTVDFDPGAGITTLTSASPSQNELFFCKLDSMGNLVFVKNFSNVFYTDPGNIELDPAGNIILTGDYLVAGDFDPSPGVFILPSSSPYRSEFMVKIDGIGDFMWAKKIGTDLNSVYSPDWGNPLAIDSSGDIYTAGAGYTILKQDQLGDTIWCIKQQDTSLIYVNEIELDSSENIIALGYYKGTVDLDPGSGIAMYTSADEGFFVQKFDPLGNLIWVRAVSAASSTDPVTGNDLKLDNLGNIYLVGTYSEAAVDINPGVGVYTIVPYGVANNVFVMRLSSGGNFAWAFQISNGNATGNSICVDKQANIFTTGQFEDLGAPFTNFSPTGTFYLDAADGYPVYFAKYSQSIITEAGNIQLDSSFSVYPNPTDNNLFIETNEKIKSATCVNYLGQSVVLKFENNSCDVSGLSQGIYFLSLLTEKGNSVTKKFIKE